MAHEPDGFASREAELRDQLAAADPVEVIGVVDATGVAGARSAAETLWTLLFTFSAWRTPGGGLRTDPLNLRRQVTEEELDERRASIPPYRVLRVTARVVEDSAFGGPCGYVESIAGPEDSDAELNHHAHELQQPVTHHDPMFGTFTLDRRVDWYETHTTWAGRPVRLSLSAKEPDDLLRALDAARTLWKDQNIWNRRVRDFAVAKLLPLKNGSWLDDDEQELTGDDFLARMTLDAITVNPDGSFDFWHDDGDLFWGHSIEVSGSLDEGPTRADIPG
jgi:hypothetical protein